MTYLPLWLQAPSLTTEKGDGEGVSPREGGGPGTAVGVMNDVNPSCWQSQLFHLAQSDPPHLEM